jgi:alkanesulfonate monooxygenase SsuD/methylene tetrahydromethanopterin reductase-like flavin-dependent oxidoreductase (luciferase family)
VNLQFGLFDWIEASPSRSPREIYAHKLELAQAADRLGLHGYFVAEHQGTPLSVDGSPAVMLSAVFQRTARLRAGALTFCLPWYNALRFYQEVCMLDHLSGGRLELGVGRGVSPIESRLFGLQSIDESREKYRETLEVFFKACASPTLSHDGKIYQYRDAELHVKPLQKPYPPLWFPSSNKDSIDFTARHGYHTALLGRPADARPLFDRYRELWEKHRHDPGRHNSHVAAPFLAKTQHIVIAERADEARRLGEEAHRVWNSHIHYLTRKAGRPDVHNTEAYSPDSAHPLMTGTPAEVTEQLGEFIRLTSINYLLCVFSFGDLAAQHAMRSLELFTRDVLPRLK